jgi:hypothetical protein
MAVKLNTEFNYRYQVIGDTIRERIKTLKWFYDWRVRAKWLEEVSELKLKSKKEKIKWIRDWNWAEWEALELEAEVMEIEQSAHIAYEAYRLNEKEIEILEKLLKEAYEIAEPSRLKHEDGTPYDDEEMFEANAANEFTAMIAKDIYAEVLANGRPSPAKLRNAMSNPITWNSVKKLWLVPKESWLILVDNRTHKLSLEDNTPQW